MPSAPKGITPRSFSADDIMRRYMAAMVNEGAKVVAEGIALRPLDVDVTFVAGYGFRATVAAHEVGRHDGTGQGAGRHPGLCQRKTRCSGSPRRCWNNWWPKAAISTA